MTSSMDVTAVITRQPLLANRFEVVKVLGEGAAGAVFHVKDRSRMNQEVALKVLQNSTAFDEYTLERFKAEIRVLQEIKHPHIVAAFDFIALEQTVAYTMEYVRGQDLSRIIESRAVTYTEIDLIFAQLLSALEELHLRGIFHRDLKLENILYSTEQGVKLSDFGLMKQEAVPGLTRTGILLGTAQYMPPEYIRMSMFDARSEIYCAGIILYELLSRARFLHDKSGNDAISYLLEKDFRIPLEVPPETPDKYLRIMKKAMEPKPELRFQSAGEMKGAFKELARPPFQPLDYEEGNTSRRQQIRNFLHLILSDPLIVALELTLIALIFLIAMKSPDLIERLVNPGSFRGR